MRVAADGQSADFDFDITGKSAQNMGWTQKSWTFVADDTSATLEFISSTTKLSVGSRGLEARRHRHPGRKQFGRGRVAASLETYWTDFLVSAVANTWFLLPIRPGKNSSCRDFDRPQIETAVTPLIRARRVTPVGDMIDLLGEKRTGSMRSSISAAGLFLAVWTFVMPAFAIDFETVPGIGTPIDQMQISAHYWFSDGVRFRLEEGGFPFLAQRGAPVTAFNASGGGFVRGCVRC